MNKTKTQRQQLFGLSADATFLNLFDQPTFSGQIEQVFRKAINISINNTLFTLLSAELDNAPNSCRLLNNDLSKLNLKEGEYIYFCNKTLYLGKYYFISFSFCHPWQPNNVCFIPENINKKTYLSFLNTQISVIDVLLNREGHSLFHYHGDNLFYLTTAKKLNSLRIELINLLKKKDHQKLPEMVRQFIGLGIGLTPSGDDYLVGLMAFLLLKHHPAQCLHPFFEQGIRHAKEATTKVSAITLEKAVNRHYRENLLQLLHILVTANTNDAKPYSQLQKILDIGSSSGSDMLLGIRDALYLTLYFGEKYVD
ncbi:DUF2877 domain-containing protein [Providencia stuartii]|uniref:DUF2877 domain-containing protein n=2 Tax=Providencia stuartii TaxID=588 RepID=A0AA86YSZ3_PROST|nr:MULTISPECIES: DUF2877 domain-containing protein [Providencia]EDU57919.1 hypothetical protein PROSTU_04188 [Providencia stuartii ATCC 25827]MCR4080568.1 DUF2877 domain-containing protein [Providencia stuartii]MTC80822.1 DUF2877 domain-containing protein [Providencia stuartii]MTC93093.1 DUF2877 domain-containing protein [Providencia stuartii]